MTDPKKPAVPASSSSSPSSSSSSFSTLADVTQNRNYDENTHGRDLNQSFFRLLVTLAHAYFPHIIQFYAPNDVKTTPADSSQLAKEYTLKESTSKEVLAQLLTETLASIQAHPQSSTPLTSEQQLDVFLNTISGVNLDASSFPVAKLIETFLKTAPLSQTAIAYLEKQFKHEPTRANDRQALVSLEQGIKVSTGWWLPLRETFAIVLKALLDVRKWPIKGDDAAKTREALKKLQIEEQKQRIGNFCVLIDGQAKDSKEICSTGVRNAWLTCLNGYDGKTFAMQGDLFVMACIRDYLMDLPVIKQAMAQDADFKKILLPWLKSRETPVAVMAALITPGNTHALDLFEYTKQRYLTDLGMDLDDPDEYGNRILVEGSCGNKLLRSILNSPMASFGEPLLDALHRWIKQYVTHKYVELSPLAQDVVMWLESDDCRLISSSSMSATSASTDLISEFNDKDKFLLISRLFDAWAMIARNQALYIISGKVPVDLLAYFEMLKTNAKAEGMLSQLPDAASLQALSENLTLFEKGDTQFRLENQSNFIRDFFIAWLPVSEDNFVVRAQVFYTFFEQAKNELGEWTQSQKESRMPKCRILLSDIEILRFIAQAEKNGALLFNPYWVNRVLLHAIIMPVTQWSKTFYLALMRVHTFLSGGFEGQAIDNELSNLLFDSYPLRLLEQVSDIIIQYEARRDKKPLPQAVHPIVVPSPSEIRRDSKQIIEQLFMHGKPSQEMLVWLLQQGLDINVKINPLPEKPNYTCTALIFLSRVGRTELVTFLLQVPGIDIHATDQHNKPALSVAVGEGHGEIVSLLLARPDIKLWYQSAVTFVDTLEDQNWTLCRAVECGDIKILQILLDKDASWYITNVASNTIGAGLKAQRNLGLTTALKVAARHRRQDMIALLLAVPGFQIVANQQLLSAAVQGGCLEIVAFFLHEEITGDELLIHHSQAPLSYAIQSGHIEIVRLLWHAGAKFEWEALPGTSSPLNAVQLAFLSPHSDVLTFILSSLEPEMIENLLMERFDEDESLMRCFAKHALKAIPDLWQTRFQQVIKLLPAPLIDRMINNYTQNSPLSLAVHNGNNEVAQVLLEAGARVNGINMGGMTALHSAARSSFAYQAGPPLLVTFERYVEAAVLLLDAGANINQFNENGETPLSLAIEAGNVAMVRLLLARGAQNAPCNKQGWSAYELATCFANRKEDLWGRREQYREIATYLADFASAKAISSGFFPSVPEASSSVPVTLPSEQQTESLGNTPELT